MSQYVREQLNRELRDAYWRSSVGLQNLQELRLIENARSSHLRAHRECHPKHSITYPAREMDVETTYWNYVDQQQQQASNIKLDHMYLDDIRLAASQVATRAAHIQPESTLSYTARIQLEQQQQQQQQQQHRPQTPERKKTPEPSLFVTQQQPSTPTTLSAQQAGGLYHDAIRISEPKVIKEGPAGPAFYPNLIERQVVRQIEVPWSRTLVIPTTSVNISGGVKNKEDEGFRVDQVQGTRIFEVTEAQLYAPLTNQPTGPARILGATPIGYSREVSRTPVDSHHVPALARSAPLIHSQSTHRLSNPQTTRIPSRPASAIGHRPITPQPTQQQQQPHTARPSANHGVRSVGPRLKGNPFETNQTQNKQNKHHWRMRGGGALPTHVNRLNPAWLSITPSSLSASSTPRR